MMSFNTKELDTSVLISLPENDGRFKSIHTQTPESHESSISCQADGKFEMWKSRTLGLLVTLAKKFQQARKARKSFECLMTMDSRQLADIGLTRTEIQACRNGIVRSIANGNQVQASEINDHRRAG
tara:strand:- start:95 stop:472 length:378 start_codon:yes stop_codon:yes gene_type:complete